MKFARFLDEHFEEIISVILLSALSIILMASIILRIFGYGLTWGDEVCRALFVSLVFIGLSYSIRLGSALRLTSLLDKMSDNGKFVLEMVTNAVMIALSAYYTYQARLTAISYDKTNTITSTLELPMSYLLNIVCACMFFAFIRSIQKTVLDIRGFARKQADKPEQ